MTHDEIITQTALKTGMALPLDDNAMLLSKKLLRSLDDAVAAVHNPKPRNNARELVREAMKWV